ncbi:MAG: hypothetical protein IPI30_14810 [Saprospiraceae bacterium]|nr:hypothetical protein [Candidatus Vicinibacter affinis]
MWFAAEMEYGLNLSPETEVVTTIGSSPSALAAYNNYFVYRNTIHEFTHQIIHRWLGNWVDS